MPAAPSGVRRACAVVGSPVDRSLSPALHAAAYADLGLDWVYTRREVTRGTLAHHLRRFATYGIDDLPCGGLSVTMPLKTEALRAGVPDGSVDGVSTHALAQWARSANTLIPWLEREHQLGWVAHNTDIDGIRRAFAEYDVTDARERRVCVIGSGDTASSAIVALTLMGASQIRLVARSRDRADTAFEVAERGDLELTYVPWERLASEVMAADLTVSTVPPGVVDGIAGTRFGPDQTVLDVAYTQGPTPLLDAVRRDGGTAVPGVLMLLHQAVVQVELMTGRTPDIEAMRAVLR
ncbi:shikimate dehydrogenase [Epidermidibacterium keratini]|uniref:shikimate dehydrogenase (NADP(+)) n=1 Tax=Epidermidibacterium keratini TaxID=1891644 RepID=A0A7L4YKI1_9ACTN|nr:shikimate dehydrogenase [Epidermidibacterium keratini]QHB99046.1 shikimate dehydrogenase [Epidermidibacterium keratini]